MNLQIESKRELRSSILIALLWFGLLLGLLVSLPQQVEGSVFLIDDPDPCLPAGCTSYLAFIRVSDWNDPWTRVGNPVGGVNKFYSVAICGPHMLAGSDRGVYSRRGSDGDWTLTQTGISGAVTDVTFVPGDCTRAYAALLGYGIRHGKFANNAWTWQRVDQDGQLQDARSIAIVGTTAATSTIYAAGNFGVKFRPVLPTAPVAWEATTLQGLTTNLSVAGDILLASVWTDGIYRASTGGWLRLGPENAPEDKLVYRAVFDGTRGLVGTETGAFLWKQSTWQRIPAIGKPSFALALGENRVFVGQHLGGVVGSLDNGLSWHPVNNGLEGVGDSSSEFQVRDLYIHSDGTLYAATTTGIWEWTGEP